MPTSEDLHLLVSEFTDLVRLEETAQHELRSLRMRRGMKRKKMVKAAGLLLVSDGALAKMVAAASEAPTPPPVPEPDEDLPTDPICPDCDGTGYDFSRKNSDGRSPQCSTCMGGGFVEDD